MAYCFQDYPHHTLDFISSFLLNLLVGCGGRALSTSHMRLDPSAQMLKTFSVAKL
jgi:hypothetical protein